MQSGRTAEFNSKGENMPWTISPPLSLSFQIVSISAHQLKRSLNHLILISSPTNYQLQKHHPRQAYRTMKLYLALLSACTTVVTALPFDVIDLGTGLVLTTISTKCPAGTTGLYREWKVNWKEVDTSVNPGSTPVLSKTFFVTNTDRSGIGFKLMLSGK